MSGLADLPFELVHYVISFLDELSLLCLSSTTLPFRNVLKPLKIISFKDQLLIVYRCGFVGLLNWFHSGGSALNVFGAEFTIAGIEQGQTQILDSLLQFYPLGFPENPALEGADLSSVGKFKKLLMGSRVLLSDDMLACCSVGLAPLQMILWTDKYLRNKGKSLDRNYFQYIGPWAIRNGRLEVVHFFEQFVRMFATMDGKFGISTACRFGSIPLITQLLQYGFKLSPRCYVVAAKYGHVSLLEFLKSESSHVGTSMLFFRLFEWIHSV
jgi:hypothetical protein